MDVGGRKPKLPDVETVLMSWVDDPRAGNFRERLLNLQGVSLEVSYLEFKMNPTTC